MTRSEIVVVSGVGDDATELGAFDAALADAGLHNYNLVTLSSVIPPGTTVVTRDRFARDADLAVGDAVAVVLASATTAEGGSVAAGLGWATSPEGGVFFEVTGETEQACRDAVAASLDGARARRDWNWQDGAVRTAVHRSDRPAAAVVVGVYGSIDVDSLPVSG
ncbi:MAG: pyruvoyl-dependent arginine decarboxylase [Haloferacaceae archaeon]